MEQPSESLITNNAVGMCVKWLPCWVVDAPFVILSNVNNRQAPALMRYESVIFPYIYARAGYCWQDIKGQIYFNALWDEATPDAIYIYI